MEKVILVIVKVNNEEESLPAQEAIRELAELAHTSGAEIVESMVFTRDKPTPDLFIGKGKAQEIAFLCNQYAADAVIFSHDLSGTHQRNLEKIIPAKIIDRTQLILDIFARHARTPEGKMQVELAQLEYLMPRLAGKGILLSRLGGGIGTRGPGEQKLEIDRRRIRSRIEKLKMDLKDTRLRRDLMRKKRKERAMPQVAIVGYTNAGKSTLLNALTNAGQVVHDGLFTTLDPLSKSLKLPNGENIVLSDTVGFLHNLPHHLIEAFKATLEEVILADLLVHVLDVNDPYVNQHYQDVIEILSGLKSAQKPMITALNKIDLLDDQVWLRKLEKDFINPVPISAVKKNNLELLLKNIQENLPENMGVLKITLPYSRMELIDLMHREGKVLEIKYLQKRIKIKVSLPKILCDKLLSDKEIEIVN
jgi:GTP-binding protein HflX